MKKLSFLFIMLILAFESGFSFVNAEGLLSPSRPKRKVPVKSTTGVPIFRSPVQSPVQVFIDGKLLTVEFQESIDVLVKIENVDTHETIIYKSYDAQEGAVAEVQINEKGNYLISFYSDTYEGWGEFTVDE